MLFPALTPTHACIINAYITGLLPPLLGLLQCTMSMIVVMSMLIAYTFATDGQNPLQRSGDIQLSTQLALLW